MELNVFKNRNFSFYFTAVVAVLGLVTAIVYAVCYHNLPRFMSWGAFAALLVGVVVALACLFFNNKLVNEIGSGALAFAALLSLCLFIKYIYNYVVIVMVGIDLDHFDPEFIVCTVLFAATLIASIVGIFLPKAKENE